MSSLLQSNSKAFPTAKAESRHSALPHLLPLSEHTIKLITTGLVIFDGLLTSSLFILAYWLRHQGEPPILIEQSYTLLALLSGVHPQFSPYLSVLYFVPLIQVATFWYHGLYRIRGEFSFTEDLISIFKAVTICSLLVTVLAFFYRAGYVYSDFSYFRLVFIYYYALGIVAFISYRIALRSLQTFYRRRHINVIPILIVGSNGVAEMCVNEIAHDPKLGRSIIGFVTADGSKPKSENLRAWPTLGRYD